MKSFRFFALLMGASALMALTSCLSNNNRIAGIGCGKFVMGSKNNPIQDVLRTYSPNLGGVYDFVFPGIENYTTDGYWYFTYNLDFDKGQDFANRGYYSIGVTHYEKVSAQTEVPNYPATNEELNVIRDTEQTFDEMGAVGLVEDDLFLATSRNTGVEGQKTIYQMYFNLDSVTVENGKRVYNIFVKGYRDKEGVPSTMYAGTECSVFNIQYIWIMLSNQEANEDNVYIRFKFLKSVNPSEQKAQWSQAGSVLTLYNRNKVG